MTESSPAAPGSDTLDLMTPALAYARKGWRVLPCHPGEKRPSLPQWPTRASTDPAVVRDWWVEQPDANIGLATGAASGFFVLDVDPKNGGDEALTDLQLKHGHLPRTLTVRTPSGGWHHYFTMPDFEVTNAAGDLKGSGIDIRGEGGQVLAPPSVTALGAYLLQLDNPIKPAPAWLLEMIRPKLTVLLGGAAPLRIDDADQPRQRAYAFEVALPAAGRAVAGAATGSRNQVLNDQVLALAGIAAHDPGLLAFAEVEAVMLDACRTSGLLADDGTAAFVKTLGSAWSAGLERPRLDWPPRDRNAGITFELTAAGAAVPVVNISSRKLNELVDEVLGHVATSNAEEPSLFVHGSEVVKVVGQPGRTVAVDREMLAYEAEVRMHFVRDQPNGGQAVANPSERLVKTMMALPEKPFPDLRRLSYTPYFSPSGRYVDMPGYDAEARTFYAPALGLDVLPIAEGTEEAKRLILDELLGDFPFVSDADRAHALALMLLPFVRDLIDGPTPMHNIEAPAPGSGKGLLMKVLLMPGVGGRQMTCGAGVDNEEWEKRLISFLRLTPQALVIDNVNDKVTSGFLCTALTEPEVTSRVLGASTHVTVPVTTTWVMTANNPKFSDEVARRVVRIRVDSGVERPEDRTGFRHADLLGWAAARRGALVSACCTLVASWVAQGAPRPVCAKPFGSFEAWQSVMAGILEHLGVEGLLENKAEFIASADDESGAWEQLTAILTASVESEWSSKTLADIVLDHGIDIDLGTTNRALAMGKELGRQRDRWHNGRRFEYRVKRGGRLWTLTSKPDL